MRVIMKMHRLAARGTHVLLGVQGLLLEALKVENMAFVAVQHCVADLKNVHAEPAHSAVYTTTDQDLRALSRQSRTTMLLVSLDSVGLHCA
jgi:hypothetical protein